MEEQPMLLDAEEFLAETATLTAQASGAWINILCALHLAKKRGTATKHRDAWGRIMGVDNSEVANILHELRTSGCAAVAKRHDRFTVTSRRMAKERKLKAGN